MTRVSNWKKEHGITDQSSQVEAESKLLDTSLLIGEPFCITDLTHKPDQYKGIWRVDVFFNGENGHFMIKGALKRNEMLQEWKREIDSLGTLIHGITLEQKEFEDKKTGKKVAYPEFTDISEEMCPCGIFVG